MGTDGGFSQRYSRTGAWSHRSGSAENLFSQCDRANDNQPATTLRFILIVELTEAQMLF